MMGYKLIRAERDAPALSAMSRLSALYPRYGYRRIRIFLRREGHTMSPERAHRLWRLAGLQLPKRRPRRRIATSRPRPLPPMAPNHVWAYDFIFDASASGQQIKCLTVVDEFTRECLAIDVAGSIRSSRVIEVLFHRPALVGTAGSLDRRALAHYDALATPPAHLQPGLAVQAMSALVIDGPALPPKQDVNASVAVAALLQGDLVNAFPEPSGSITARSVAEQGPRDANQPTGAGDPHLALSRQDRNRLASRLVSLHGAPAALRSDNGPEFISKAILEWLVCSGIHTAHIDPGKPWQNGTDESFNGKFRDECLSVEWFRSREEARVVIEQWRRHYNHVRPHSSLEYQTPVEFKLRYDSTTAGAVSKL